MYLRIIKYSCFCLEGASASSSLARRNFLYGILDNGLVITVGKPGLTRGLILILNSVPLQQIFSLLSQIYSLVNSTFCPLEPSAT